MRFNKLDLNLLVALDALLTERSITRASARINLSPSATSNALSRLRVYFDDELLVQIGRQMELTPRAIALQGDLRDILNRIQATLSSQPAFEPQSSHRTFRIFATEYAQSVLGSHVVARAAALEFGGLIEFSAATLDPHRDVNRDEADLLLVPEPYASGAHPSEWLLEDSFSCVVWSGGRWGRKAPTQQQYLEARHAVVRPVPSFENQSLDRHGIRRVVAVVTPSFSVLPSLVVGTDFLATVHTKLARQAASTLPLTVHPMPFDIAPLRLVMQWHQYHTRDPGTTWLRGLLADAARELQGGPCAT